MSYLPKPPIADFEERAVSILAQGIQASIIPFSEDAFPTWMVYDWTRMLCRVATGRMRFEKASDGALEGLLPRLCVRPAAVPKLSGSDIEMLYNLAHRANVFISITDSAKDNYNERPKD